MSRLAAAALLTASPLAAAPAFAVPLAEGVTAPVQVRTRVNHHQGRDGDSGDPSHTWVEQRTRLGLGVALQQGPSVFVQIQDVRAWGEELHTLFDYSADGLDVHQAYLDLPLLTPGLVARIGRQELSYDEQRLIGPVGWTPQGRSFDAVRLRYAPPEAGWQVDALYAQVLDVEDALGNRSELIPPNETMFLTGAVARLEHELAGQKNALSLYGLAEHRYRDDLTRATLGLWDKLKLGPVDLRVEGYYQTGEAGDRDISAFLLAGAVGTRVPGVSWLQVTLWADYLSGDDDPTDGTVRAFDTLYGTNHAFYGFADFFINIPAQTQQQGLVDLALKLAATPAPDWRLGLDVHRFLAAEPRGGPEAFGWEVDGTVTWTPMPQLEAFAGAFLMVPDAGLEAIIGGDDADLGLYLSVQGTF